MLQTRVIPCLLKKGGGLVKTTRFNEVAYIGDPINTIQIFNNFEVDELVLLDITATKDHKEPDYEFLGKVTDECFMPFAYGGGITTVEQMKRLFSLGIEKCIINTKSVINESLIKEASTIFGSQSVVVSIDVKKNIWGKYSVFTKSGAINARISPLEHAKKMELLGAGEILLTSIDRDGTMEGYDTDLIKEVASGISIPLIACGGAGKIEDIVPAVQAGASAVAAGSIFIYQNTNRSVLVNFPKNEVITSLLKNI